MTLTPEQKQAVTGWVAAGDNLSAVQKKISEQFKISLTYRDVRFLVDDLNLDLKDAAPKIDTSDLSKAPPPADANEPVRGAEKKGFFDQAKGKGVGENEGADELDDAVPDDAELVEEDVPAGAANVTVAIDQVTLIPGALASGTMTFSDGVTGKWLVDQYGRPGFTDVSQPGYRPTPADGQAFMQELNLALQKKGF